ncbi:hypothetical protein [Magnetospirillum sp. UT-4]|uniref:hypothetical protein n=1 Tax=Magnetospirillum sp. UT-4 TaxID=2681467 RepID=UPI001384545F|nr:hypothetical protein [Magnetospirillum sp. UT-4]CAA7627226.1 conserved hypothetical protein [Magnetospirillum sp. UT-4]
MYPLQDTLPTATTVMRAPHRHLPRILHQQLGGTPRAYCDAELLADRIQSDDIVIDDVSVAWRPALDETLLDILLADEPGQYESLEHRHLKVHARVLALATCPTARLEPESLITGARPSLRADLVSWNPYGIRHAFECGVLDGRHVLAQLEEGVGWVTVLPFAGLGVPFLRAYTFRRSGNPPLPAITVAEAKIAWQNLRDRSEGHSHPAATLAA